MSVIVSTARAYWRFNERLWQQLRRFAIPILAVLGVASLALWGAGLVTGNAALLWAPAYFAWALAVGHMVSRLPR
ncbi:hypothetical protein [Streptomyces sp. NPDC015131]|uniref:hypothetical protein n=1 Tax=Streptomyces sp. NPDC015131 TaxID=3364941 RepID=UPI0037025DA1